MNSQISYADVDAVTDQEGNQWRRIRIQDRGQYLLSRDYLPNPIYETALDVVELGVSLIPGFVTIAPKEQAIVTTERIGPGVILQIEPKCGPTSAILLAALADESPLSTLNQLVPYEVEPNIAILDILVERLQSALRQVDQLGWAGADIEMTIWADHLEGTLHFEESLIASMRQGQLLLSQGVIRYTHDIPINRVIATTLQILAASLSGLSLPRQKSFLQTLVTLPQLTPYSDAMEAVEVGKTIIQKHLIPPNREYYLPVLHLCNFLLQRFAITQAGRPEIDFPPIRLPMATLFEKMVRNVVAKAVGPKYVVRSPDEDIRVTGRQSLYKTTSTDNFNALLKPDIVIRATNDIGKVLAVFDVKYKFEPSSQDHYQLYAYMDALGAKAGGFVFIGGSNPTVYQSLTYDRRTIFGLGFDLSSIQHEVQRISLLIKDLVSTIDRS